MYPCALPLFVTYEATFERSFKIIINHCVHSYKPFDYSINKVTDTDAKVIPFTLDMALLYEHYVYGLLYKAYGDKISYQFKGKTGYSDFLYRSEEFKAILDTKYIPKYSEGAKLDTYVVRQLSGYSRDLPILRHLGYQDIDEESPVPSVPCVIVYPENTGQRGNPFVDRPLENLCTNKVRGLSRFYKISIPIPLVNC